MDSTMITALSAVATAVATAVMIWAVYAAPHKAFEAQWKLQLKQEAKERRMKVFKTLMATRGNVLHQYHVEALNLIDVEFSEPLEQDVRDSWKTYLDHLNIQLPDEAQEPTKPNATTFITGTRIVVRISSLSCCKKWVHVWATTSILPTLKVGHIIRLLTEKLSKRKAP
jgi:hypothetical protein